MFPLLLLVAAGVCQRCTGMSSVTALRGSVAALPCPHRGDVTWSRLDGAGALVLLVSITNGLETHKAERYSSLADNSLVIKHVLESDSTTYFCNNTRVYLHVTTDPSEVVTGAGTEAVTQRDDGRGLSQDTQHRAADWWKIPVGVVVGAGLVLSVVWAVRSCSTHTRTTPEVIYEEIQAGHKQPGDSYFESPYSSTSISDVTDPSHNNLYSSVRRSAECVYSLAQGPGQ